VRNLNRNFVSDPSGAARLVLDNGDGGGGGAGKRTTKRNHENRLDPPRGRHIFVDYYHNAYTREPQGRRVKRLVFSDTNPFPAPSASDTNTTRFAHAVDVRSFARTRFSAFRRDNHGTRTEHYNVRGIITIPLKHRDGRRFDVDGREAINPTAQCPPARVRRTNGKKTTFAIKATIIFIGVPCTLKIRDTVIVNTCGGGGGGGGVVVDCVRRY